MSSTFPERPFRQRSATYGVPPGAAGALQVIVAEPTILPPPRHETVQVPPTPTLLQLVMLRAALLIWPHGEQNLGRPLGRDSLYATNSNSGAFSLYPCRNLVLHDVRPSGRTHTRRWPGRSQAPGWLLRREHPRTGRCTNLRARHRRSGTCWRRNGCRWRPSCMCTACQTWEAATSCGMVVFRWREFGSDNTFRTLRCVGPHGPHDRYSSRLRHPHPHTRWQGSGG
jgi:hypothetical protein